MQKSYTNEQKRPDTLYTITEHIVKTAQGLDQSSLEKIITYLTENGVSENIPSFYVNEGLSKTLSSTRA